MTDTDLIAQADAALDGVTEGPWTCRDTRPIIKGPHGIELAIVDNWNLPTDQNKRDARFIAASRQLVPDLRDALAAALARVEATERALHHEKTMRLEVIQMERASSARVEALEKENARLREALAEVAAVKACTNADQNVRSLWKVVETARAARAAFTDASAAEGGAG